MSSSTPTCWVCGSVFGWVLIYQFQNMSNPVQNRHTARRSVSLSIPDPFHSYSKTGHFAKEYVFTFPKIAQQGVCGFWKGDSGKLLYRSFYMFACNVQQTCLLCCSQKMCFYGSNTKQALFASGDFLWSRSCQKHPGTGQTSLRLQTSRNVNLNILRSTLDYIMWVINTYGYTSCSSCIGSSKASNQAK